eukprot:gene16372-biopygen2051
MAVGAAPPTSNSVLGISDTAELARTDACDELMSAAERPFHARPPSKWVHCVPGGSHPPLPHHATQWEQPLQVLLLVAELRAQTRGNACDKGGGAAFGSVRAGRHITAWLNGGAVLWPAAAVRSLPEGPAPCIQLLRRAPARTAAELHTCRRHHNFAIVVSARIVQLRG